MATVTVHPVAPSIVQVLPAAPAPPITLPGSAASVVAVVMDRGPSTALLTGIAEEAATRERDDPLLLINAMLNPGL